MKMNNDNSTETKNWPDLALSLYERLTGRGAEISYDLRNMEVLVPNKVGPDAMHTLWKVNGVIVIRTSERSSGSNGNQ